MSIFQFPNWIIINTYLENIFKHIIPQINESFYFTNAYFKTIQNMTRNEIALILLPLHHFQVSIKYLIILRIIINYNHL